MSTADSNVESVARVYGDVLLELAQEQGAADSLLEELTDLGAYLSTDAGFEKFLTSPDVDISRRAALIEKAMRGRASDLFVDAMQVINRKGRMDIIRAVIEAYRLAHEALRNQVDVHVTTAVPLNDELRGLLAEAATLYTGKEAKLVESVDEDVLGGLVMRVGDTKLDSSLLGRLRRVRESLARRGTREIVGGGEDSFVEGQAVG